MKSVKLNDWELDIYNYGPRTFDWYWDVYLLTELYKHFIWVRKSTLRYLNPKRFKRQ
jgi:hypothetical protein